MQLINNVWTFTNCIESFLTRDIQTSQIIQANSELQLITTDVLWLEAQMVIVKLENAVLSFDKNFIKLNFLSPKQRNIA